MDKFGSATRLIVRCRAVVGVAMMHTELTYWRRRVTEENAAADAATDLKVRAIHLELARRYDERIGAVEIARRESQLHLVSAA